MYTKDRTNWIKHLDFIILDLICLHVAFILAYAIRFPRSGLPYSVNEYRIVIIIFSIIQLAVSVMVGSHDNILRRGLYQEAVSAFILTALSMMLTVLYLYSVKTAEFYSRLLLYYTSVIFIVLDFSTRLCWKKIVLKGLRTRSKNKNTARKVFVITDTASEPLIRGFLEEDIYENFSIAGVASNNSEYEEALRTICREWIDEVFVYLPCTPVPQNVLERCTEMGVTVHIVMDIPSVGEDKQFVESLGGRAVVTAAYSYMAMHQVVIKRIADIIGGLIGSIFAVVIGIIIGPIIYRKSPGAILFRQTRIGKNGKQFQMLKFRSMYPDADARKAEYMAENRVDSGMMFKLDNDPRIIPGIGEFIRKTSLDEFPQFFNVLKGDMSLVGTRPPTVDEWEKYEYHHRARLAVKPGITGMWQVSGRSEITDFEEVVKLDTEYITNYRLGLDLKILLKTVAVIFKRKGAL